VRGAETVWLKNVEQSSPKHPVCTGGDLGGSAGGGCGPGDGAEGDLGGGASGGGDLGGGVGGDRLDGDVGGELGEGLGGEAGGGLGAGAGGGGGFIGSYTWPCSPCPGSPVRAWLGPRDQVVPGPPPRHTAWHRHDPLQRSAH